MQSLFKTVFTLVIVCFIFNKCRQPMPPRVAVTPKKFSMQFRFDMDKTGIAILAQCGADQAPHKLYLDNHSPSWANDNVIKGNKSFTKSTDFLYSTTTADGKTIEGDVYICDSVRIGTLNFANVPFYNISNESNAGVADGVIGENMMSEGVWKIDFEKRIITFASSSDSIKNLQQADLLPAVFASNAIVIEVGFHNAITQKLELDLGYNGCIMLPQKDFTLLAAGSNQVVTNSSRFSTPGGFYNTKSERIVDTARIGNRHVQLFVTSNNLIKEKLIGLGFFKYFEFLVIDYINKKVYMPRRNVCISCYE